MMNTDSLKPEFAFFSRGISFQVPFRCLYIHGEDIPHLWSNTTIIIIILMVKDNTIVIIIV